MHAPQELILPLLDKMRYLIVTQFPLDTTLSPDPLHLQECVSRGTIAQLLLRVLAKFLVLQGITAQSMEELRLTIVLCALPGDIVQKERRNR